jgi:hydroxymethylglutaryl-CoA synthase
MAGIVGYGACIPRKRIKAEVIARQWGKDPAAIQRGLLLEEKSVPGIDEDTITISVTAGRAALARSEIEPASIGAIYVGSESHPYAVKPSGTIVSEALGIGPDVHVADFEFACKAGTEAMFVALGLVESGRVEYALAIGADTSQGAPNDALEFSASGSSPLPRVARPSSSGRRISSSTWSTPTATRPIHPISGGARASSTPGTAAVSPASQRTSNTS